MLQAANWNFIQVYALIKKAMPVGNTNFSFVTENLRIFKIFPMKITILGKMKNFKFTFHKNELYH